MKYTVVKAGNLVFECMGGRHKREVSEEEVKGAAYTAMQELPDSDGTVIGTVLLRGEDGVYCEVQLMPVLVPIEHSHAKTLIGQSDNGCFECGGTGVHDPATPSCTVPDVPEGWHIVERCDNCEWFDDDMGAARVYYEDNSILEVYCTDGGSHVAVNSAGRR